MESSLSKYEITRGNKVTKAFSIFTVLFIIFLISTPWWLGRADIRKITEFLYILSIAQMWNLLAGYAGLLSVGQQLFIGIGAYCLVIFAYKLGMDPFLVIPLAGFVSLIVGYFVSKVAFRLKGAYFAVGTWVLAETFRLLFANSSWVGGGSGLSITKTMRGIPSWWRESLTLWFAIFLGIGSVLLVTYLLRSKYGLSLTAVRDNETASESLGIKVKNVKLFVYLTAAFVTGMAGALIFITKLRVSPEAAFSIEWTAVMFFIVVIGGIGTIEGPIIGTLVYITMRETMNDLGSWYLIILGIITIIIMIKAPQGLWGLIKNRFNNLHFFAVKRHVVKKE
jgi:branched-chain amino acid transport system permease protein